MSLEKSVEAILFVAGEPLTFTKIAKSLKVKKDDIESAVLALEHKYDDASGVVLVRSDDTVQLVTHKDAVDDTKAFTKSQIDGDLTAAQLETLTVIAYRGPVTRPELEQIRGVNCAIILRNLMMRGLIQEKGSDDDLLDHYTLSIDALTHLGIKNVTELPDYERLSEHEHIATALEE